MALITNSNKVGFVYVPVGKNLPGTLTEGRIYFNANTSEILINDGVATRVFGVDPSVLSGYLKNSGDQFLNGILKLPKIRFGNSSAQSVHDAFIVTDGYDLKVSAPRGSVLINSEEGVKIKEPNEGWGSLDIGNGLRIYGNDDTGGYISVSGSELISFEGAYVTFHEPIYFGGNYNSITWSQYGVEFTAQPGFIFNNLIDMKGNRITDLGEPQSQGDAATMKYVDDEIDSAISTVYKPSGSLTNTVVEATAGNDKAADYLIADNVGNVYNVTNGSFTTHSNLFKEGNGKTYPLGTNIVVIKDGASYLFDVLAGFVDLSSYLVKNISQGSGISISNSSGTFTITNNSPNANHTGDVTGSTELTIGSKKVTTSKIDDGAVTLSKLTQGIGDTLNSADTVYNWYSANAQSLADENYVDEKISTHTHGQLSNDGKLTDNQAKASGFKFVMTDGSNLMKQVNIALTSGTTKYLREDGSWGTPTNTNTTYTFATGDSNGQFKVTPSGGSAQNVSIKGLGSAAYTSSDAYLKLSGGGTMNGPINMGNWNITNLSSPQNATDAVNKTYVDESILWTVIS